jgi:two-component system sensor histidine kinase HydH
VTGSAGIPATEEANASTALTRRDAMSARIASLQTLTAGLAHEVRNPLNSALLQLELLERRLRRAGAPANFIEPVEQVSHELERLTRLLNDFLAFARPSQLALADHDVRTIVGDVVAAEQPFAAARDATLQITGIASLRARVDAPKLRLIALNLVRNALEAAGPGGHVVVTVAADDDYLRLAIEDDGPGIPEAVRSRVYEPFFTTKHAGTGLGLSIVHGLVAAHGGTVAVDSAPGQTRFDVALPRHPA